MSLVLSCASWFRHTFAWSNSRQSWIERGCAVGLVVAGFATAWLSPHFSLATLAILWGLLILGAAILSRRGWLKIFGPVLFYDMVRAARRGRYFLLRVAYAGLLLFILFSVSLDVGWQTTDHRRASFLALKFFEAFILVQLVAVS